MFDRRGCRGGCDHVCSNIYIYRDCDDVELKWIQKDILTILLPFNLLLYSSVNVFLLHFLVYVFLLLV